MKLHLSHWSALYYWRHLYARDSAPGTLGRFVPPAQAAHNRHHVEQLAPYQLLDLDRPVDALVFHDGERVRSQRHRCHLWTTGIPSHAFCQVGPTVRVSSPEFVFLQLAPELPIPELAALGMELCGMYSLRPASEGTYVARDVPLTTGSRLLAFARAAKGARGRSKAMRVARFLLDRSASPGETAVALFLCLPVMLGGYGLPKPCLNYEIELSAEQAVIARRQRCFGDACWPKHKYDVEYNGSVHEGRDRVRSDAGRTAALMVAGYRVMTVTWDQLSSIQQFDGIARDVARHVGHRLRSSADDAGFRRMELRSLVFGWNHRGGVPAP